MKKNTGHRQAQRLYEAKQCSVCGSTERVQRHHLDLDSTNNKLINMQILCDKCHRKAHVEIRRNARTRPCAVCGKLFVPRRKNRGKLCSKQCRREMGKRSAEKRWANLSKMVNCAFCGKQFAKKRARNTTCSRSCGNKLAWARRGIHKNHQCHESQKESITE